VAVPGDEHGSRSNRQTKQANGNRMRERQNEQKDGCCDKLVAF
jgi:hypothetical protein